MSKFAEYWADLKLNHPEEYQEKLKKNRERIQAYRKRIYSDKTSHENHKKANRKKYKERFDRMKAAAKVEALAEIMKEMNIGEKKQKDDKVEKND